MRGLRGIELKVLINFSKKFFLVEEYGADAGINYSLYAICNHYGSLYGGHYTSFVKYFATQKWYTFNDAQ